MGTYLFVAGTAPTRLHDHDAPTPAPGGAWIRLPAGEPGLQATRAAVTPGLAGVLAPRACSAPELAALAAALAEAEENAGLPLGTVAVIPVLETATGVLAAAEIARAPRVARLLLGEASLRADLGMRDARDEDLLWLRTMTVVAGAAAGIRRPVADVCPDPGRFAASCADLARLGFGGRLCAGDDQVARAAEIFADA